MPAWLDKQNQTAEFFFVPLHAEHKNANMMVLAVLSHGRDGHVYTSDGLVIATESIYEKFNNNNCPLLKGKPKFFIIQVRMDDFGANHPKPRV